MKRVAVIGGGAAGMLSAIAGARNGAAVTIYERNNELGKKILATGNGRCNLTNARLKDMNREQYLGVFHGDNPLFAYDVISQFDYDTTISFFESLGITLKNRGEYIYPFTDQAQTIRDALVLELKRLGVSVRLNAKITGIRRLDEPAMGFELCVGHEDDGTFEYESADSVILACGSRASAISGSDGFGYKLCKKLSIPQKKALPSLTKCVSDEFPFEMSRGVRWDGQLTLLIDGEHIESQRGEIQFTENALSGIVSFQLSSLACRAVFEKHRVEIVVDLLPDYIEDKLVEIIKERNALFKERIIADRLMGLLNNKLIYDVLHLAGVSNTSASLEEADILRIVKVIKGTQVLIANRFLYDHAQTCSGGVLSEVLDSDLQVRSCKGVYVAGELIDIDGLCGGYNLQFAWSSGYVAGKGAASLNDKNKPA